MIPRLNRDHTFSTPLAWASGDLVQVLTVSFGLRIHALVAEVAANPTSERRSGLAWGITLVEGGENVALEAESVNGCFNCDPVLRIAVES
jgi:hypothetical protein